MRRTTTLRLTASAAVMAAVAFGSAGAAVAQDPDGDTVDAIIVTAQKREQSLQEVPIVVTTLSEQLLEDAGVKDIKDLQILTPGLTVTSTQSEASTTARIRGVGTVGDNPGLESSVGVVIDGVYRSRNGVGFGDLGELSRIEVLKGPQGTLFGKNTSAGVINILTEAPSFTPGFEGEVTGSNYGGWGIAGSVTGPLSEQVAGRLYMATRERDGFYDVDVGDGPRTRTDDANQDFWTTRGQLLILPSEEASIRLIADYTERDEFCCAAVQTRTGPTYAAVDFASVGTGQAPPTGPDYGNLPFSRQAYSNRDTGSHVKDYGLSAEVNLDFESLGATFTSLTSWRGWESINGMDLDYSGMDFLYRNDDGSYASYVDNLTQEFRLAGTSDRFDWLIGAYGSIENVDRDDAYEFGADYNTYISMLLTAEASRILGVNVTNPGRIGCLTVPGLTPLYLGGCVMGNPLTPPSANVFQIGSGVDDHYSQRSETLAFFTNNTWRLTDQFDVTFGLRATMDEKRLHLTQDNLGTNGATCGAITANGAAIATAFGNPQVARKATAIYCLPWANPLFNDRELTESHSDEELSGTIKASYRPTDNLMIYGSYAHGYKGFGYNMDRVQSNTTLQPETSLLFPSETVDSYEFGVKSTLFDGSMLLNVTYFDQTFENFQLNTFLGTAFVVESIPELTTKGIDADLIWFTPVEGLTLQGGLTYTDAQYGQFGPLDMSSPDRFPQLSLLPGATPSFAPEWSGTAALTFDRSIGMGLRAGFNVAAKYTSDYNTGSDLLPYKMQDAFTIVNGRVSIGSEDDRWALEIWSQNLTDEEYKQVGFNAPLQGEAFNMFPAQITGSGPYAGTYYLPFEDSTPTRTGDTQTYNAFLGAPRTYGVTLKVRY